MAAYVIVEVRVTNPEPYAAYRDLATASVARHGGLVHVARPVLEVADDPLLLERAEERAHRRVARRVGDPLEHVGHCRPAAAVEEVHDLPLAAAEAVGVRVGHDGSGCGVLDS